MKFFSQVETKSHILLFSLHRNQRELMNSITSEIQKVLPIKKLLYEREYLVGLEIRIEKMMKLLDFQAKDVRVIGIHGIGGLGKTTLAKAIYNRSHRFFKVCSFIENVREKGLVQLQEQLIQDISKGKRKKKVSNTSEGTQMIIDMVGIRSVLLVLDDVDDRNVLEALVGNISRIHSGSRIIITTRHEEILKLAGLQEKAVYMLEELDEEESFKLFNYHAFEGNKTQEEYIQLSKEVVTITNGLPLILEIFGSLFKTAETLEERKKLLEELRVCQHSEVHEKLRICYDKLKDNEKLIFLDIACLLVKKNLEDAVYMWEGHRNKLSLNKAIRSLQNRSLIKISNGKFVMHDQLRDMGREIIRRESLLHPEKLSRLWFEGDVVDASNKSQGNMIEGILLNLKEDSNMEISTQSFESMSELRILLINFAIFSDSKFQHLPASLKWLEWNDCPLETLPIESNFKGVVVLNLSRSFISQLWSGTATGSSSKSTKKRFEGLKVLDLSSCDCLNSSPNFAMAPNLEKLILDECSNLKEVDDSIVFLKSLRFLSMRECVSLETLPNKIYELNSLKVFNLEGCTRLAAFPQFPPTNSTGGLLMLEQLILRECESLKFLPGPHKFHSLKSLHIDGCQYLNHKYLFEDVANRNREWDELCISGSETESSKGEFSFMLPIGSINDPLLLQQLKCHGSGDPCENGTMTLHVHYEDMTNKFSLDTTFEARCDCSTSEDNVYGFCYTIYFGRSDDINEAPRGNTMVMKVTAVNNFRLSKVDIKLQKSSRFSDENMMKPYISISRKEASISPLTSVEPSSSRNSELEFSMVFNLYEEDKLKVVEYSTKLDDRISDMMRQLDAQCGKQMLLFRWTIEELIILMLIFGDSTILCYEQWHGVVLPRQASDKVFYHNMKVLDLSHCKFLVRMPDFIGTPHLEKLILDHCEYLLEIGESTGQLENLALLSIVGCTNLLALPCSILQLNSLQVLNLEGCSKLKILPQASIVDVRMESLQELILDYCTSLRGIPDYVGEFKCLRHLSLKGCPLLVQIPPSIGCLVVLEEMNVAQCQNLVKIFGLQYLRSLKALHMNGCDHLDHRRIHGQLKGATFHDLEAFSISIVNWNIFNPSFSSPSNWGNNRKLSCPFPRGGLKGREPLNVEKIHVVLNDQRVTTKDIVLHFDVQPIEPDVDPKCDGINREMKITENIGLQVDVQPVHPDVDPNIDAQHVEPDVNPHFDHVLRVKIGSYIGRLAYAIVLGLYCVASYICQLAVAISFGLCRLALYIFFQTRVPLFSVIVYSHQGANLGGWAVQSSYEASFRREDEINEQLRVEALARTDDAASVGMLLVSCTEPTSWLERGDIWFHVPTSHTENQRVATTRG